MLRCFCYNQKCGDEARKLGILVMDELTDMWREQKNRNDFALDFTDTWQDEAERLVRKDYKQAPWPQPSQRDWKARVSRAAINTWLPTTRKHPGSAMTV